MDLLEISNKNIVNFLHRSWMKNILARNHFSHPTSFYSIRSLYWCKYLSLGRPFLLHQVLQSYSCPVMWLSMLFPIFKLSSFPLLYPLFLHLFSPIFLSPSLFNGLLHSWRADLCALRRSCCALYSLAPLSPHQGNSSELFIPTHAHSPATVLITGWVCHLKWAQVLLPARLSEIESPSHLPRRAEAKGLHSCQELCSKTGQLLQGEPHPAHKSEITFPLGYDIPRNEVNMKICWLYPLSVLSLISFEHISLEVQQKVSYYFSVFNIPFYIMASVFSITLYHIYSFLVLKI